MAKALSPAAVKRVTRVVIEQLGQADKARLGEIIELVQPDGRVRLGDVLGRLYPDSAHDAGLAAFRQFRARIGPAAEDAGLRLTLAVDSQTRSTPEHRWCWFEGDDGAALEAAALSKGEVAGVQRDAQDAVDARDLEHTPVRFFISYAHEDKSLKDDLLRRLMPRLKNAAGFKIDVWTDGDIVLSEDWHETIQKAILQCHFGLLLISDYFLTSDYIGRDELPKFITSESIVPLAERRAIPVALKDVDLSGKSKLKGLEKRRIFFDSERKAFSQRQGNKRDAFAHELFKEIIRTLEKYPPATIPPSPTLPAPAQPSGIRHKDAIRQRIALEDLACFVPTEGRVDAADKLRDEATATAGAERRDALDFLQEWVAEGKEPYCALLGDTGMGKTTTCRELTRRMLDAFEVDPTAPLPIYLDLRNLGAIAQSSPSLPQILETVLDKSWPGGRPKHDLSADEVIRLVQENGALVIFDGLDEVLVHLSPAAGQVFTHELYRILPPHLLREGTAKPGTACRGKLLLSCRTHYFRTARDQKAHLTGHDRDRIEAQDFRVLLLLPFTEVQIRNYFKKNLPGEDPDRVMELIRSVHNLPELAERPYTLSLISKHIGQIERWKLEGRKVTGVDLYRHMVLSWLERDFGKHQLSPDHKQQLMEHFAAALWRSGKRAWSVDDVEQWLIDFLVARPQLAAHYDGRDRNLLKEDLRTATFLVREGESDYRFAHTSLLEFFLAAYLHRALRENRPADWDLPMPSRETLDFLGQMLAGAGDAPDSAEMATLRAIRGAYRPRISELAFAYMLAAQAKGYPAPSPAGFRLEGADLHGWTIAGDEGQPPLNLNGASFCGANLRETRFHRVDLSNADFTDANLTRAEIRDARAPGSVFCGADLTGTLFRDVPLDEARFERAKVYRSQWLACRLTSGNGLTSTAPEALFARCEPGHVFRSEPAPNARMIVLDGHTGRIRRCAFSPDGQRIASAGDDGTLRLWDVASGEPMAVLRGHEGWVWSCAFSPNGRRIASAGQDGTLRLWDATSGEPLAVLRGHDNWINACAFSPNGRRIASAGGDGTLRLWDSASGEPIAVLRGHENGVTACAFSPVGQYLASAGDDRTLRLWDAISGEPIAVLRGHENSVGACAFSPNGQRIASAGLDATLRLWDVASGEPLAVLRGHEIGVNACAFSPDGQRIASASDDGTLRVWNAATFELLAVLRSHEYPVRACAFSPDGQHIASAGMSDALQFWDATTFEPRATLRSHEVRLWCFAFSPDGQRIASANTDGTLRLWGAASGEPRAVLRGHKRWVLSCDFSPDGRHIASANTDGTLRLWDAATFEQLNVLHGGFWSCTFSTDGRRIASTNTDGTLRIWDVATFEPVAVLYGHGGSVWHCAFSPDGRRIASVSTDHTVRLWDATTFAPLATLRGDNGGFWSCAFSPDGRRIVSAGTDAALRLWDVASGDLLAVLRGHEDQVWSCAFSPDGQRIASAGEDATVRLWDAASGEPLAVLRGHEGTVHACAFSPDGQRIASASYDGTLRLWDVETLTETGFRVHHFEDAAWASLAQPGNRVIRVGGDAWRYLGWVGSDPEHGLIRYPAEVFGPLPTSDL